MMSRTVGGDTVLFHPGARAGYGSYVLIVPSRRFASVTLTNRSSTMLGDWNRAAAGRLAGIEIPESDGDRGKRETLSESQFRPLLGAYANPPKLRYELFNSKLIPWTRAGGQFFSKRGPMRMAIHRVGRDRFTDDAITFSLTRDADGEPRWLHGEYRTLVRTR